MSGKIIDLFSGCGGLSIGFIQNGYDVEKALEFDPMIAETYKANHPDVNVIVDDIKNVDQSGVFETAAADSPDEQHCNACRTDASPDPAPASAHRHWSG